MKLRFYMDLRPGYGPDRCPITAVTNPGAKKEGCKRLSFEVAIPDRFIYGVDEELYDVTDAREIKDVNAT